MIALEFMKRDNKQTTDDYIYNGLIFCGKCHTPKQEIFNMGDKDVKLRIMCKCEIEQREEEERKEKIAIRENKRKLSFPENKMIFSTFANDDKTNEKITNISSRYVTNFPEMLKRGKGLLFYGGVGVGKSFYAAAIMNALIDLDYHCLMTNFARLVNEISGMMSGKQEYIDHLNKYDLLVIDDLATERDTDYMNEMVYNIINSRYLSGLPTIITTNLSADEMKNAAAISKQRVFSRVLEMCLPVKVDGQDRRKAKLAIDYIELRDMLGL